MNAIQSELWMWIIFAILSYAAYLLVRWLVNIFYTLDD